MRVVVGSVATVIARVPTEVVVDAATVYAEGQLWGLRAAAQIVGRYDDADIPPEITKLVRQFRSVVYFNQWRFEQGRPVTFEQLPDRSQLISRIAAFLELFPGDESHE